MEYLEESQLDRAYKYNYSVPKHKKSQDNIGQFSNFKTSKKVLVIFHQNIRGLNINKFGELLISSSPISLHVIWLTEHHLCDNTIDTINFAKYNLGAKFCRNTFKKGGVCMLVNETVQYMNINLEHFCKEKDLEACAVKLHLLYHEICIITIYKSPSGNLQYFLHKIHEILNMLYSNTIKIIICRDININYLSDSTYKQSLHLILAS
jgi:hypothetical protein